MISINKGLKGKFILFLLIAHLLSCNSVTHDYIKSNDFIEFLKDNNSDSISICRLIKYNISDTTTDESIYYHKLYVEPYHDPTIISTSPAYDQKFGSKKLKTYYWIIAILKK